MGEQKFSINLFLKAIRVYQWVKNLLIFLPLLLAHQWNNHLLLHNTLLAFFAYCLCASSVYLVNDLIDLEADRKHSVKCLRPFASGHLSLWAGRIGAPLFFTASCLLSLLVSWQLFWVLIGYFTLTLLYSLKLKRLLLIDVVVLSVLYYWRVIAGSAATSLEVSAWMSVFSIFLFFSLALAKRASELKLIGQEAKEKALGRAYLAGDFTFIQNIGVASGYMTVIILALYINSEHVKLLYQNPYFLWPMCLILLYWVSYIWLQVHRGKMLSDPIVFTLKDPRSYFLLAITLSCGIAAKLFPYAGKLLILGALF